MLIRKALGIRSWNRQNIGSGVGFDITFLPKLVSSIVNNDAWDSFPLCSEIFHHYSPSREQPLASRNLLHCLFPRLLSLVMELQKSGFEGRLFPFALEKLAKIAHTPSSRLNSIILCARLWPPALCFPLHVPLLPGSPGSCFPDPGLLLAGVGSPWL